MRDPFSWSLPLGRLFGITIKVHWLFPLIVLGMILRAATVKDAIPNGWIDASIVCGLLFFSVLLHEFGHCFMARSVGGEATEVLLWPLGGLANVELPQQPRAHFLTALAGPAVNFFLALGSLAALLAVHDNWLMPSFDLIHFPGRGTDQMVTMQSWAGGDPLKVDPYSPASFLNWFFWVNWVGFVLNMVLIGFPLDAGRMLQASLWPRLGYRQATLIVVYCGYFVAVFVLGVASLAMNETLVLALALFVGIACYVQQFQLQTGEDSLFGYDFSQGYTSLERDQESAPAPKQPRQSWWQRWMQQRAEKKARREAEQREAEERRMDELLEKVQRAGIGSLTEEERRFMKRVSERLRNRRP
jgi:Zn-dependent protease